MRIRIALATAVIVAMVSRASGQAPAHEPIDTAMNARIRSDGLGHSQVLAIFNHLTNVIGPRLTGSPAFKAAADWASTQLTSFGLADVHQESWPFGRGWSLEQASFAWHAAMRDGTIPR